ncbi:MAG: radical SAM protein, partial [Candidatus Electrothrix sp. AR3]|nr:radical SAM protein [Candidatus Electrothrix sp. AR3]
MLEDISDIEIDITGECNLRCTYCYLKGGDKYRERKKFVLEKDIDNFLDIYKKTNGKSVRISFFGGEPLIEFDKIRYAVNKFRSTIGYKNELSFRVITNGTLINNQIAQFCNNNNIYVQVTLDGKEQTHNLQRKSKTGHGSFKEIIRNIKILQEYNVKYQIRV